MRQIINYSFRIELVGSDTDAPNPLHLCEEIQAYLNAHVSGVDANTDEYVNAEVVGYNVRRDNFTPFIAQSEY